MDAVTNQAFQCSTVLQTALGAELCTEFQAPRLVAFLSYFCDAAFPLPLPVALSARLACQCCGRTHTLFLEANQRKVFFKESQKCVDVAFKNLGGFVHAHLTYVGRKSSRISLDQMRGCTCVCWLSLVPLRAGHRRVRQCWTTLPRVCLFTSAPALINE